MKRFAVFHTLDFRINAEFTFMNEDEVTNEKVNPDDYELVALVLAEDIEKAFEFTNHIDKAWWENKTVKRFGPETRSTSVGDVIMDMETRDIFVCLSVGWKKLEYLKVVIPDNNPLRREHVFNSKWDELTFDTWVDMALDASNKIRYNSDNTITEA